MSRLIFMNDCSGDHLTTVIRAAHLRGSPGEIQECHVRVEPRLATALESTLNGRQQQTEPDEVGDEAWNGHE